MNNSYHVHSLFSDGQTDISTLVRAAVVANLDEIGISDHLVLATNGNETWWSMNPGRLPEYFESIRLAAEEVSGEIEVKFGIEADFDPRTLGDMKDILASFSFDYVIGSVHFVDGFPIDESKDAWEDLSPAQRNDMIVGYWDRVTNMAKSRVFDIAGHLDLYKKFGHLPTFDSSTIVERALKALQSAGMAMEINTAGWYKDIHEAYPSSKIIEDAVSMGIPAILCADAHRPDDLTRGYERGLALMKSAGYTELASFSRRQMSLFPLPL